MKNLLLGGIATFFACMALSCNKKDATVTYAVVPTPANFKLKYIHYAVDTAIPLSGNDTSFLQRIEYFTYTAANMLEKRYEISARRTSPATVYTYDTTQVFSFLYNGNGMITGYSQQMPTGSFHHTIDYDPQNRPTRDSVTNAIVSNNKVTTFSYKQDTVFMLEKQTFPVGLQITIDSIVLSNGLAIKQFNKILLANGNSFSTQIGFTATSYENPLSKLSNFGLMGSDYKNGVSSMAYTISNPENISKVLSTQVSVKYWASTVATTQYTNNLSPLFDTNNRVTSIKDLSTGRTKQFTYY